MTLLQAPIIIWWRMLLRSAILEWVAGTDATDTDGSARQLQVTYNDQDALALSPEWQVVTNFVVGAGVL